MTTLDDAPVTDLEAAEQSADDRVTAWAEAQPWWRRPRRMNRQLSISLALVALVSVLLVGTLNFFAARSLLQEGTEERLVGAAESQGRSIEEGAARLLSSVSALSSELTLGEAFKRFDEEYTALADATVSAEEEADLADFYSTEFVEPLAEVDAVVTVDELLPQTDAGRYLQTHYVAVDADDRAAVDDAGDGSGYSEVHAEFHPYLRDLTSVLDYDDIKLVNVSGDVVYSVAKQTDVGTNMFTGPYQDSNLAVSLEDRLPRSRTGDAVMSDFELYLPTFARPTGFAMALVRADTELLGAVVVEIPGEALSRFTTADGQWDEIGLGEGESYLVGTDRLLRSESRLWIEDPDAYLDKVDDDLLRDRIAFLGSPVGLQKVDTTAVSRALDGETFTGNTKNYLGEDVFSYSRLIDVAGVNWVVVADVPNSDARAPLVSYIFRIGLTLAILLPLAAVIGAFIAGRLTRPIPRILGAAEDVVRGERDPDLPEFGRNEFGDLARRLRRTANRLGDQEADLARQFDETRAVLLAALPPRAVAGGTTPTSAGDLHDVATAISIALDLEGDDPRVDDELADLYATASQTAEHLASERGVERVRAAADRYLFVAGLGEDHDGADVALDLAAEFARQVTEFAAAEQMTVELRIGVSTGYIETGLMTLGSLSYTAWGDPVRNSMVIGSLSVSTMVGVDTTTVEAASDRWSFAEAPSVVGLDEEELRVFDLDITRR